MLIPDRLHTPIPGAVLLNKGVFKLAKPLSDVIKVTLEIFVFDPINDYLH